MIGETLSGYRVVEQIGDGGMGIVYAAEHTLIGKRAAVKVLLPEFTQDQAIVRRFFNEAKAASRVHHPGIVEIYDFGHHNDGSAFIIMELLRGETLSQRLRRGPLDPVAATRIITHIAGALGAAHSAGIVHRDLKPDNIFLVPDSDIAGGERAKVLDFGIAKLLGDRSADDLKTRTGAVMGTPRYMSPEQCKGAGEVDHRADLYSLGCIAYHMLSGRPPFIERGVGDLLVAHMMRPPAPLSSLVPNLPPTLDAAVMCLLAKPPEHRFATAEALLAALDGASGDAFPVARPSSAPGLSSAPTLGIEVPFDSASTAAGTTLGGSSTMTNAALMPRPAPRRPLWQWGVAGALAAAAGVVVVVAVVTGGDADRDDIPTLEPAPIPVVEDQIQIVDEAVNVWVRVAPPDDDVPLGLSRETIAKDQGAIGFRPERGVMAPRAEFEIQQHEVSWQELDPWLDANPEAVVHRPDWVPEDPAARAKLAATGVPWKTAYDYCKSHGGRLPSEAEWEYAARGPERRRYAWGKEQLDMSRTHVYRGEGARVAEIASSDQDRTPGPSAQILYDMTGNAQEWVADLWRNDKPGEDESWVQTAKATFRTVRGLPLGKRIEGGMPREGAAYRDALCAVSTCLEGNEQVLAHQGFRCARDATP